MKLINTLTGGYRRVMDTLLGLQNEMITMGNAPFAALGVDLVLSGCAVTDIGNGTVNIASGIMYVAGNTLRFDAVSNIPSDGSKAITTGGIVTTNPQPFGDGSIKNIYSEAKAIVTDRDQNNTQQIVITTTLNNLQQYIKDRINANEPIGTIKEIYDLDGTFINNFDASGKGTSVAWQGWALDNGNNGTPGSAGRVLVGAGMLGWNNYIHRTTGGEETHQLGPSELPETSVYIASSAGQGSSGNNLVNSSESALAWSSNHSSGNQDYDLKYSDGSANIGRSSSFGSNSPHNNMQPYMVVYRVVKIGTATSTPPAPPSQLDI